MQSEIFLQKKYTFLIRKINVSQYWSFLAFASNSGHETQLSGSSQCLLNQEISIFAVQRQGQFSKIQLHISNQVHGECYEIGTLNFDMNQQRIVKPLCNEQFISAREYFAKHFDNRMGYIEYKLIGCQTKKINRTDFQNAQALKEKLVLKLNENRYNHEQIQTLKEYIAEKDEINDALQNEVSRLINQIKKLQRNLSREKQRSQGKDKIDKGINLNVKVNPSSKLMERQVKAFQREREDNKLKVQKLLRQIRQHEKRQERYRQQIQKLKHSGYLKQSSMKQKLSTIKGQYESKLQEQRKKRSQIWQQKWQKERELAKSTRERRKSEFKLKTKKMNINEQQQKISGQQSLVLDNKVQYEQYNEQEQKHKFIQQKMQQHIKKLEQELINKQILYKQRENKLKNQLQQAVNNNQRRRVHFENDEQKQVMYQKQIAQYQSKIIFLNEQLNNKENQVKEIVKKLQKAQNSIEKLEDQNIRLRKQMPKSPQFIINALHSMGNQQQQTKNIAKYEKKQIDDQKLKTQMEDLKYKMRRMEQQYDDKIKNKDIEIMRLSLSEKSAVRQKQVYEKRINQMMSKAQGTQKQYFQALQQAHKYETMQLRARQLDMQNKQLENANQKLSKQKSQSQKQAKKLRNKIEERQSQWVRLKSIESQHEYYKSQCEKFEKANKKFEKQYENLREYVNNIHNMVGKKPVKTKDQERNKQNEKKYKDNLREKLQALEEQAKVVENKYYHEQMELWLTERTNLVQFYAKKLEEDRKRINELDEINVQNKQKLIQQKIKQIESLRDQQIEDIDRKIQQIKDQIAKLQNATKLEVNQGTFNWQVKINDLDSRMKKINDRQKKQNKQNQTLKKKVQKLTSEAEQQKKRYRELVQQKKPAVQSLIKDHTVSNQNIGLKKSGTQSNQWKYQQMRKSFMDIQKSHSDQYKHLREVNTTLNGEKSKLQIEIKSLKHQITKQKMEYTEKLNNLTRQNKKNSQFFENRKNQLQTKIKKDAESLAIVTTEKNQLQVSLGKYITQLNECQEQLNMRQVQVKQLIKQNGRINEALDSYQLGQRKLLEDVRKYKQNIRNQENQFNATIAQREERFVKMEKFKNGQIQQLKMSINDLQNKNQKQIVEQIELSKKIDEYQIKLDEYDRKLKEKEEEYKQLQDRYNFNMQDITSKANLLEQQNQVLKEDLKRIADQIYEKQIQCEQLGLKVQFGEKKQESLFKIKQSLQKNIEQLKTKNTQLERIIQQQDTQFEQKSKQFENLRSLIDKNSTENTQLKLKIVQFDKIIKTKDQIGQQKQIQLVIAQKQIEKVQISLDHATKDIQGVNKRLQDLQTQYKQQKTKYQEKIKQLQSSLQREGERPKSKQSKKLDPSSPLHRTTAFTKPNNLKSLSKVSFKKSISQANIDHQKEKQQSAKTPSPEKKQQQANIRYSGQDMNLHIIPPSQKLTQSKIPRSKASLSKVNIQLGQSDEQHQHSREQRSILQELNYKNTIHDVQQQMIQQSFAGQQDINMEQILNENEVLKQQLRKLQDQNQQLQQRIEGLESEVIIWKKQCQQIDEGTVQKSKIDGRLYQKSKIDILAEKPHHFDSQSVIKKQSFKDKSQIDRDDFSVKNYRKQNSYGEQVAGMQQKLAESQLTISQLNIKIKQIEQQLQQTKQTRQKALQQLQSVMKTAEEEQQKSAKIRQYLKGQIQTLEVDIKNLQKNLQQNTMEGLKKDDTINESLGIIQQLNKSLQQKAQIIEKLQKNNLDLNTRYDKINKTANKNKIQYRKYQQQSELEILHLREQLEAVQAELKDKKDELAVLAEKYLDLQTNLIQKQSQLQDTDRQVSAERAKFRQYQIKYDNMCTQLKRNEGSRGSLIQKISDLQMELSKKNQQIKQMTKQSAMLMKKNQITLEAEKNEHDLTRKKLRQRQQHITSLKLQLARYNQLCHNLQNDKTDLSSQILKIEKQLKDIMKTYQKELNELHKDKQSLKHQLQKHSLNNKETDQRINILNKQISKKDREIKQLTFKIEQNDKQSYRVKQRHRKQITDIFTQLQFKNNEYEKIKVQLERESQHYFTKECQFMTQKQNAEALQRNYKQKLSKYEEIVKQMQQQLKLIKDRPSNEQYEQILFQNQLYKNRIEELQIQNKQKGDKQQQRIYAEFRRYKMSKQKQINDLQMEMEKYANKFHDLEENNYILRKDNQSMKSQLRGVMQQKIRMQKSVNQYQDDIKDLKEELAFYKNKRVQDLNKLLNETYD